MSKYTYSDVSSEDAVLCEKCGHEMIYYLGGHCCGMTCPNCGWGWATTYFEPYETDMTDYHILLEKSFDPSIDDIRIVSNIANCNYIAAKKLINNAPVEIFCGKAIDIMPIKEKLEAAGIDIKIKPEFPY